MFREFSQWLKAWPLDVIYSSVVDTILVKTSLFTKCGRSFSGKCRLNSVRVLFLLDEACDGACRLHINEH
jgi:hypothetical protein